MTNILEVGTGEISCFIPSIYAFTLSRWHTFHVCSPSSHGESPFPNGCHLAASRKDWRISGKEGGQSVFKAILSQYCFSHWALAKYCLPHSTHLSWGCMLPGRVLSSSPTTMSTASGIDHMNLPLLGCKRTGNTDVRWEADSLPLRCRAWGDWEQSRRAGDAAYR